MESGDSTLIKYIDKLQRANADDLAFYPLSTLERELELGRILVAYENDEPAGYLWFGALRGGYDVTIFQACIDYDLRRQHLGFGLLNQLNVLAVQSWATGIRLKCASSALSNMFWQAAGFYCTRVTPGGLKRGRDINHYRTDLQPGLFVPQLVTPSTKAIDERAYRELQKSGEKMPSRFKRTKHGP